VTAVIVTYRSSGVVGAALAALKNCCDAGFLRCVVVDNASPDATADLVAREHPWVTLIRSPQNLGYGRGCNLGLEQVQTPYVIAMNPDVVVEKESVERLLRFMERHPKAGMAAPATLCGGSEYQHVGGMPTPWSIVTGGSDPMPLLPDAPPFSTDWLCGAFMLMRTGALREVRGFDPRFFLYFEETDLCLRLRKAGYELWAVGEAKAIHAGGASVRRVDPTLQPGQNLAVHFFASRYYYLTKHHGRVAAVATETAELLVKGLRDLLRAVLGKRPQREFRTRLQAPMFTVPPDVGLGP
jgi:GT2 family glycosyltransferase